MSTFTLCACLHDVSVSFSSQYVALKVLLVTAGKCHCCYSLCTHCISVDFSWQGSKCLYDGVYVNEVLGIDQSLLLLHTGKNSNEHDTNSHTQKSPVFP